MKVVFRNITGRQVVMRFNSWQTMMRWLSHNFPLVSAVNDVREYAATLKAWDK